MFTFPILKSLPPHTDHAKSRQKKEAHISPQVWWGQVIAFSSRQATHPKNILVACLSYRARGIHSILNLQPNGKYSRLGTHFGTFSSFSLQGGQLDVDLVGAHISAFLPTLDSKAMAHPWLEMPTLDRSQPAPRTGAEGRFGPRKMPLQSYLFRHAARYEG